MGLPECFNRTLHVQLGIYAAWLPISNTIALGDYGRFEGGVFRKTGNISEFNVDVLQAAGPATSIDFMSGGTRVRKFVAGVEVPSLQGVGDVDASLSFDFSSENSAVIKAGINVVQMENINQVGRQLARHPHWEKYYYVVSAVYIGEQCVVIATAKAGTTVEFSASASVLEQIDLGKVAVKPSLKSSSNTAFQSIGDTGPLGLRLFKINWRDKIKLLGDQEEPKISDDWGDEVEDDF